LHRILARITTNTQTRQRSKVPPPQLPFFGARERNRNGAHSRRAKKTKTHTSSWHDDDGVVSCSFLKSCGLFHHFLLLCVRVCVVDHFIFIFLSLDRLKKKQFVESCDGWSGADQSVAGWTKWKLALAFGSHTVQREKKKKKKKGVTGWKYSSVGIEAERHRIIIIPSNSGRHSRTADHWTYTHTQRGRSQKLRVLQTFFFLFCFFFFWLIFFWFRAPIIRFLSVATEGNLIHPCVHWGKEEKKCYVIIHRNKNTE
jgi:hypothetical protein